MCFKLNSKGDVRMKYEGKIFKTIKYGDLVVTKYINNHNVCVKFINTNYETTAHICHIRNGLVKDRLFPSLHGVGVVGDASTTVDGIVLKECTLWRGVIGRCYNNEFHKKSPTYADCSVSEKFKYYPYFKEWCGNQIGFNAVDDKGRPFELDKDILIKGNKVYSENTCCFVPAEINGLFIKRDAARGDLPIGVWYHKRDRKYAAQVSRFKENIHLGYFSTPEEAFNAYKEAKEDYIKEVANKWKDQIDPRVYEALINYKVLLTD